MNSELTEEHKKLIDRIARENDFTDYELVVNPGSVKGGNFMGNITAVTVKSGEKKLEFILKTAFTSENSEAAGPLRAAYKREIHVYSNIFKEFKKFQEENSILDPFTSIPKVYGYSDLIGKEYILMENLKAARYQLWDKTVPMNPQHISAVLKEYAKFHAISLAMSHKNPTLFKEIIGPAEKNIFEVEEAMDDEKVKAFMSATMKSGYEAVHDQPELTKFLQKLESRLPELFAKECVKKEYKCVLSHGDCWCNNFLFKYQDSNDKSLPSSIRILDWQLSHLTTPASDFAYFFIAHSTKETLDKYDSYLELYYNSLSNQLKDFDCDPEQVFPYSRLKKHCELQMEIMTYQSILVLKIMLCDSEEAPDFSSANADTDAMIKQMDLKMETSDVYNQRVKDIVQFMIERNFGVEINQD